jgi:hypothetical protein
MSEPTEADRLGELFRCERYLSLFPTGMPKRACLRRQLERLPSTDARGKVLPLDAWPPAKVFCAKECALGRENLVAIQAFAIQATTCTACGSALVGGGACPGCAARALDAGKSVPSGNLAKTALGQAPMSTRLYTGEVPDVAIGPPPGAAPKRHEPRGAARVEVAGSGAPPVAPKAAPYRAPPTGPAPRAPAEEAETMAKGTGTKQCRICGKGLRVDNTRGICGKPCKPKDGKPAAASPPKERSPAPTKSGAAPAATPRKAAAGQPDPAPEAFEDLLVRRSLAIDELAKVNQAIRARREALKLQLDQVDELLGKES